jgi:hypothetical protein
MMISEVDLNANGVVDYAEFVRVLENHKARVAALGHESDLVDAFIACGGNADQSGVVERERLVKIIREDFGLAIDIEQLFAKYDAAGAGQMEYAECVEGGGGERAIARRRHPTTFHSHFTPTPLPPALALPAPANLCQVSSPAHWRAALAVPRSSLPPPAEIPSLLLNTLQHFEKIEKYRQGGQRAQLFAHAPPPLPPPFHFSNPP